MNDLEPSQDFIKTSTTTGVQVSIPTLIISIIVLILVFYIFRKMKRSKH